MVAKRYELPYNVVEAAQRRIRAAFSNGVRVYLSLSGGKDSIVMAELVHEQLREGRIDPEQLVVIFVDEEAVFDEVDRIARDWRRKFIAAGAEFRWYCIEVKHFNCFNQLTNDESFICWDSTMPDRWVRPIAPFAITDHPQLRRREDTYQEFLRRICVDGIAMVGTRVAESVQRLNAFRQEYHPGIMFQPIFDWKDTDVWRFIQERELDFPETYLHLYQTGSTRRQMRISQFFSIDTARSLVKMNEYEPGLMDRIIKREPNAYLASLYWDSEMFRGASSRSTQKADGTVAEEGRDFKKSVIDMLQNFSESEASEEKKRIFRIVRQAVMRLSSEMGEPHWRMAFQMLESGDPKDRTRRALYTSIASSAKGYK